MMNFEVSEREWAKTSAGIVCSKDRPNNSITLLRASGAVWIACARVFYA